ncbi:MAG: hypothetical protein Q8K79_18395 [Solirubrobacteraceae bacterium]|nr:hypothetical protein [Solirubrobacteraceae bacterium]
MHPTRAAHERWIPTNPARPHRRAASATALAVALAAALLGADAAQANTLHAPTYSAGARATVPMTISASGVADTPASLRVYVQRGGACPTSANVVAGAIPAGSTEVIAQQPTGPFSYSATFTPPVAGSYSICAFLFGSTTNTGTSATATSFGVGPAPPPPPAGTTQQPGPGATGATPRRTRCVVPTLKGRTYLGARKLVRRAGCSVGIVYRPDRRTKRIREAQGKVLRVVSQYPRPRSVRRLNFRLMLRLAYVNPPRRSRR